MRAKVIRQILLQGNDDSGRSDHGEICAQERDYPVHVGLCGPAVGEDSNGDEEDFEAHDGEAVLGFAHASFDGAFLEDAIGQAAEDGESEYGADGGTDVAVSDLGGVEVVFVAE